MAGLNKLYDNLIKSGKVSVDDIGTYEVFSDNLKREGNAKKLYKNLSGIFNANDIGDEHTFISQIQQSFQPQTFDAGNGITGRVDERGDTTYIHPDKSVSNEMPAKVNPQEKESGSQDISHPYMFDFKMPELKTPNLSVGGKKGVFDAAQMVSEKFMSDPNNVMRAQLDVFRQNPNAYKTSDEEHSKVNLSPAIRDYYEKNKKYVLKQGRYNRIIGDYEQIKEEDKEYNDELMRQLKDFSVNTEPGKNLTQAHEKFIGNLENEADSLLQQIEEIRNVSEKNSKEYADKHNISTWTLKGVNGRDDAILNKSANLLKNTKLLLSANRDGNGFWKGLHLTNEDLRELLILTESFYNDKVLNQIIDKYQENPSSLNKEENIILQAKYIADQIQAGVDPGSWYNIGTTTKESLPFMRDFILTGGVGSAASAGVKAGAKAITSNIAKSAAGLLAKELPNVAKWGGRAAGALTDLTVRPAVQTIFSPSSYAMAFKEMQGQAIDKDENGNLVFDNRKAFSLLSPMIENHGEVMGEVVLDKVFQKLHLPVPAFLRTKAAQRLSKTTGIQGPMAEYLEEKESDLINLFRGEQTIEGFLDPRQNLETFGSVAIMQIPFSAINGIGYNIGKLRDVQAKRAIREGYERTLENFNHLFGEDAPAALETLNSFVDKNTDSEIHSGLTSFIQSENFTDEQKRATIEYLTQYKAYSGINQVKEEQIQQAQQEANEVVSSNLNPKTNSLMTVKVAGQETALRVTDGTIVLNEEGAIDVELSDKEIYYEDADGKIQVAPIGNIEGIVENIPAEQAIQQASDILTAPINAEQENDEVRPYEIGESVRFSNGNTSLFGVVAGMNEDGSYAIQIETPNGIMQTSIEPRQIVNEDNLRGVEQGSMVEYRNDKGETLQGEVDDMFSLRNEGLIGIDGDVIPVQNIIGLVNQEQNNLTGNEGNPNQIVNESVDIQGENADVLPGGESKVSEVDTPQQAVPFVEQIPKDNKGTMLFENVPAETTLGAMNELFENEQEVRSVIEATIANNQKQLEKVSAFKPSGDIQKDITNKQKAKAEKDGIQKKIDYWSGVLSSIQPTKESVAQQLTGKTLNKNQPAKTNQGKVATIPKKTTPFQRRLNILEENVHTIHDRILFGIASGAYKFRWKDKGVSVGLAKELGLSGSENERRVRISLLSNEGYTPSTLAHLIWEETGGELNDNDIRDEIINVLSSISSRKQALEKLEQNLNMSESEYLKQQEATSEYEKELREQENVLILESTDQFNEESALSFEEEALSLGATLKELKGLYTSFDFIDLIEQLKDGRRGQTGNERGNQGEAEIDNGKRSSTERTQRTIGERNEPGDDTRDSDPNPDSGRDRINLSPEERHVVDEITTEISAEITAAEKELIAQQKELSSAKKRPSKAQAKTQGDLFGNEQQSTLFDVPADLSKENVVDNILIPIQEKISAAQAELNNLINNREVRIQKKLNDYRNQGDILTEIAKAEAEVNTSPTEAQKEAGNYKKGHVTIQGFDISIEQSKGSVRSGVDENGKKWSQKMKNTYGYIRKTESKDGDHIDVFLGDNPNSDKVFVVDQINPNTGEFDEHKVMMGFETLEKAKAAYLSNYEKGWTGFGNITETTVDDFKKWSGTETRKVKPFNEYKRNQPVIADVRVGSNAFLLSSDYVENKINQYTKDNNLDLDDFEGTPEWERLYNQYQKEYPKYLKGVVSRYDEASSSEKTKINEELEANGLTIDDVRNYDGKNILFQSEQTPERINQQFNDELQQQIDGKLPKGHVYQLGTPSEVLQSAGIPNLPIELAASRLGNKSMQENHPFDLSEVKNLPQAIQNPLAVFRSATHIGSYVIMTEIEHKGKNYVVAIETDVPRGRIDVNSIRSIHYRSSNAHMANWITEGLLEWVDKEKMLGKYIKQQYNSADVNISSEQLGWISKQRYNSAEVRNLFNHATKIIQNFENPAVSDKQISSEKFKPTSKSNFNKLIQRLMATRLAKEVVTDAKRVRERFEEITDKRFQFEYRGVHRAPGKDGSNSMDNLSGVYGEDLYTARGLRMYGDESSRSDRQSYAAIRQAQGMPEMDVKVYRAVPKGVSEINTGDWVTPSEDYAHRHGEENMKGEYDVIEMTVKAGQLFNEGNLAEWGVQFLSTPTGDVYGWVESDGTVYLDETKMNVNTPIHEFAHLWQSFIEKNNPELYKKGYELVKNSLYMDKVRNNPAYANLSEKQQVDEAMAMVIGDRGEAVVQSKNILSIAHLKTWLNEVWNWIGSKLGIRGLSSQQIQDLTLDQFTEGAVADLMSGELVENGQWTVDSDVKSLIADLFEQVKNNLIPKKSVSIGKLTEKGKEYLSKISGLDFREYTDFMLNPSDLRHIYNDHYGENEKDKGNNIPLTDEDIKSILDVVSTPDRIIFLGKDPKTNTNKFTFLKKNQTGIYRLVEVYGEKGGKLTAKSFLNSRKDIDKITEELNSLFSTSETHFDLLGQRIVELSSSENKDTDNSEEIQDKFQFIGEIGATNLDKAEEATIRIDNLRVAREMESAEKNEKSIKLATGWERGADGKWRYETEDVIIGWNTSNDEEFRLTGEDKLFNLSIENRRKSVKLHELVKEGKNNELFISYPELLKVNVRIGNSTGGAHWADGRKEIVFNQKYYNGDTFSSNSKIWDDIRDILGHEIQHAIQDIEGFARGGNPGMFSEIDNTNEIKKIGKQIKEVLKENPEYASLYRKSNELGLKENRTEKETEQWYAFLDEMEEKYPEINDKVFELRDKQFRLEENGLIITPIEQYKRLAGEVESRNVQSRMNLTPEQRRHSLARETEDVAREDQIFLKKYSGRRNSEFNLHNDQITVNGKEVNPVDTPKHDFKNFSEARKWAKENITGTYKNTDTGEDISISGKAIDKYLSMKAVSKSVDMDAHLSALKQLPKIIETSVLKESHLDRNNDTNIKEIQRFIAFVRYEGKEYPVKLTVKAIKNEGNKAYSYEVMEIKSSDGTLEDHIPKADFLPRTSELSENESHNKDTSSLSKSQGNEGNNEVRFQSVGDIENEVPKINEGEGILDYAKRVSDWWKTKSDDFKNITKELSKSNLEIIRLKVKKEAIEKELKDKIQKAKDSESEKVNVIKDVSEKIENYIRDNMSEEIANEMGLRDFQRLVSKLHNPESKKDLDAAFRAIDKTINGIQNRKYSKVLDKLLKMKVLDKNNKGVSIAKNVDNETRESMEYINANKNLSEKEIDDRLKDIQERFDTGKETAHDIQMYSNLELIRLLSDINTIKNNISQINSEIDGEYKTDAVKPLIEEQDSEKEKRNILQAEINELTERLKTETDNPAINSINQKITSLKNEIENYNKNVRRIGREIGGKLNHSHIEALENEAIEYNRHLIDAYKIAVGEFHLFLETGKSKLRDFKTKEIERRREIGKETIEAVKSKPILEQGEEKNRSMKEKFKHWLDDSALRNVIMSPLGNLNFMLKYIDKNHPMGEGKLYKRFLKSKDGVFQAGENYYQGLKEFQKEVVDKSEEIFGMKFDRIIKDSKKTAGVIEYLNSEGETIRKDMSYGELLYIYMVSKMGDGKAKLGKMGIDEIKISKIEAELEQKYVDLSNWIQGEFLPQKRDKYDITHKKIFGASMAKRDNYFPLQYSQKSQREEIDTGEISYGMPSTMTGNIINRVRNNRPLDLTANAFDVLMEHGQKMEEWNAYARLRKDFNGLLSNLYVKNLVEANDPKAHKVLVGAARVAVRSYSEKTLDTDKLVSKLNRMVAGGAISWRVNTAIKQILSYPAFFEYSNNYKYYGHLLKNTNPIIAWKNFNWAKENLPGFAERWESGNFGNEKLSEKSFKVLDTFTDWGMFPNRFIDAMTVVAGSKSIYDFAKSKYEKQGYTQEEADNMAKFEAAVSYNETQQSARPEFLAPIQKSGTWLNRSLSTFQNNNFSYLRKLSESIYEISRDKEPQIAQLAKEYEREGMSVEDAKERAEKEVTSGKIKAYKNVLLFGVFMGTVWKLAEKMIFGLWDDDEEKKKDIISAIATSPLDGMCGIGSLASSVSNGYSWNPLILSAEWLKIYNKTMKAAEDEGVISLAFALEATKGTMKTAGVDFKTFLNMYTAIEDCVKRGDWDMTNAQYFLNAPASVRKSYASKIRENESILEYAERVARAYDSEQQFERDKKKLIRKKLFSDNEGMMTDFNRAYEKAKLWKKLKKEGDKESKKYKELKKQSELLQNFLKAVDKATRETGSVGVDKERIERINNAVTEINNKAPE